MKVISIIYTCICFLWVKIIFNAVIIVSLNIKHIPETLHFIGLVKYIYRIQTNSCKRN